MNFIMEAAMREKTGGSSLKGCRTRKEELNILTAGVTMAPGWKRSTRRLARKVLLIL